MADDDWTPLRLEQLGEEETCPSPISPCATCPCLSPLAPAGLPSDLESTSTAPGGLRGGGLPQAVQGAPSPLATTKVFPAPCQDSLRGLSSSNAAGSPEPSVHCLCEGVSLSQWPQLHPSWGWCSPQGWRGDSGRACGCGSPRDQHVLASLL